MKSLFAKKIICKHCNGFFKRRIERGKVKYCCTNYEAKKGCTKRIPIEEDFLLAVIEKRFQRKLSESEIKELIEKIEIEDKLLFTIWIKDQEPIIYGRNHIVY